MIPESRHRTPPNIARELGISPEQVIAFIHSGELRASNLARRGCKRPRWRISPEALRDFLAFRECVPKVQPIRRGRTKAPEREIQFF